MEAVGIFVGVHPQQCLVKVESVRQRVLDDIGIDVGMPVETIHRSQEIVLRGITGHAFVERADADLLTGFVLLAHITCAGAIIADENSA